MDANSVITLIGSLGFPIVACIYMFKIYEKQTEVLADLKGAIIQLSEKLDNHLDSDSKKEE